MFDRRRRRLAAVLVLPVWLSVIAVAAVSAPPASASTITTPTSCTNTAQAGTSALNNTVSGAATPNPATIGDMLTLSGATFGIDVPGTVLLAGYGLGLLSNGVNNIPADVIVTLNASNTAEGTQTLPSVSVLGVTTITDPTPAARTSGDETATPLSVSASLPTSTWTTTGGDVAFSLGGSSTTALVGPGGVIAVNFSCVPGTPGPAGCGPLPLPQCTTTIPASAAPFDTVTVTAAADPVAPVCTNGSLSVGVGGSLAIDLASRCTDANGDIDPATFGLSTPSEGTLTAGPTPATYTYEPPATAPASPVVLDFTVDDLGGLTSNTAQLTITVNPASAPVCTDKSVTGAIGDIQIDLSGSCTDADGDIDLSTFTFTELAPGVTPGTFVYSADATGVHVLTFTVEDSTGLVSNSAKLTITVPPTTSPTTPTTAPTASPSDIPTKISGTGTYVASCTSALPNPAEMIFKITGSTLSPTQAGSPIRLEGQVWEITVPANVVQLGLGTQVIKPGDMITGSLTPSVFASNTMEGTATGSPIAFVAGPVQVDGAGQALALNSSVAVPDMSWTAVGGDVAFSMGTSVLATKIGAIGIDFTCAPMDSAISIVTAKVTGATDIPAAVKDVSLTRAAAALPRTGASPLLPIALAVGLIDLGYLFLTSATPARRRLRHLVQR